MKFTATIVLIYITASFLSVKAIDNANDKRVIAMRIEIESHGLEGFIASIKSKGWVVPVIPSKWHVEHVSTPDQQASELLNRDLGKVIALQLSNVSKKLQTQLTEDERRSTTVMLLDLSDWCSAKEGYGNLLLARRCLDLAAVGLAYMIYDLNYPEEKFDFLVKRLDVPWMSVETRRQVLNQEAGSNIFPATVKTEKDLEQVWTSGLWLRREQNHPEMKIQRLANPLSGIDATPEIVEHLDFFEQSPSVASLPKPISFVSLWDTKGHERFAVGGLELQNVSQVEALSEFRRSIGYFPTKDVPSAPFRGTSGAFFDAWYSHVKDVRRPDESPEDWNRRYNRWAAAESAWEALTKHAFRDEDIL